MNLTKYKLIQLWGLLAPESPLAQLSHLQFNFKDRLSLHTAQEIGIRLNLVVNELKWLIHREQLSLESLRESTGLLNENGIMEKVDYTSNVIEHIPYIAGFMSLDDPDSFTYTMGFNCINDMVDHIDSYFGSDIHMYSQRG